MSRAIFVFTIIAVALWTLLSVGAWAAVSLGGDLIHGQIDWLFAGDPSIVPAASWLFRTLQGIGIGAIAVVWLLGTLALWAIGSLLRRVARGLETGLSTIPEWEEARRRDEQPPMKDITPPRADPVRRLPRP
jgi:hypothetical protein